ncbi:hypothetical protein [Streptomyces humi]
MTEWPPPAATDAPSTATRNTHILELSARREEQPHNAAPPVPAGAAHRVAPRMKP